ncbi:MAG: tetratricopeptide repeat protein [Bacteroidales bacterium]|nr:tetratricopeptide repeat protein [Bacteroidales bacterium]
MKKYFVIFFAVLFVNQLVSQDKTIQLKNQVEYARLLLLSNPDSTITILLETIENSIKEGNVEVEGESKLIIGVAYSNKNEYEKAIEYLNLAADIFKSNGNNTGLSKVYNNIGNILFNLGTYKEAIEQYEFARELKEKEKDEKGVGITLNNIGNVYFVWGKYLKAEEYQLQALKIFDKLNFENGKASCYINLGLIYEDLAENISDFSADTLSNYDISVSYFEKALDIYLKTNNKYGLANSYGNLGNILSKQRNFKDALENYTKEMGLRKEVSDKVGLAASLVNIGIVYYELQKINLALSYAEEAEKINLQTNHVYGLCKSLYLKGLCFERLNNVESIQFIKESYKLAVDNNFMDMQKILALEMSKISERTGNYKDALNYYKLNQSISDSLVNTKTRKYILELKTQYELNEKEYVISTQQQQIKEQNLAGRIKDIKIEKNRISILFLVSGLFLLTIVVIAIAFYFKQKKKNLEVKMKHNTIKAHLEGQEEERRKIAVELHDDVGNSLAGAGNILTNLTGDYPEISILYKVEKEVTASYRKVRMFSHQLAHFASLDRDITESLGDFIDEISLSSKAIIEFNLNGWETNKQPDSDLKTAIYRTAQELIINSIKHSEAKKIKLNLKNETHFEVIVEDDGKGFDQNTTSKGMGLNNIAQRVEYYNGKLEIETKPGSGCKTLVIFPKNL